MNRIIPFWRRAPRAVGLAPRAALRALTPWALALLPWVLALAGATTAQAATSLAVVQGSGEMQMLSTQVALVGAEALDLMWSQDGAGAVGGTWRLVNVSNGRQQVAAGNVTPAPAPGKTARFTLAASAFGTLPAQQQPLQFELSIVPYYASGRVVGAVSPPVVISVSTGIQLHGGPMRFGGADARFPQLELVKYRAYLGEQIPGTLLLRTGIDLTLKVRNTGGFPTDAMWAAVGDDNGLVGLSAKFSVPPLKHNEEALLPIHLDAVLPLPDTQLGHEAQVQAWRQRWNDACGVALRGVLDWRAGAQPPLQGHQTQVLAPPGWQSFVVDGLTAASPICKDGQCISPCEMSKHLHRVMDHSEAPAYLAGIATMGHAFFVGRFPRFDSYGMASNAADGGEVAFMPDTKMTVASVSKFVTAALTMRLLQVTGRSLDDAIGPYLPSDWPVSDTVRKLSFRRLLSHTSGIKDYGNVKQDYDTLRTFFSQPVKANNLTPCQMDVDAHPSSPINTTDLTRCYSNYNYSILRLVLPRLWGYGEDVMLASRPQTLADQYVQLARRYVFEPVGVMDAACAPPANGNVAFAHSLGTDALGNNVYGPTAAGVNFGDVTLVCGAAGWYLSAQDLARVMLSLLNADGRVLNPTPPGVQNGQPNGLPRPSDFQLMMRDGLGFDLHGPDEAEKNGGWAVGCDKKGRYCQAKVGASVAVFGPRTGPQMLGILLVNSDVNDGTPFDEGAQAMLELAHTAALKAAPK